eukprot:4038341-Pyramimonas_sp.AAC.1
MPSCPRRRPLDGSLPILVHQSLLPARPRLTGSASPGVRAQLAAWASCCGQVVASGCATWRPPL